MIKKLRTISWITALIGIIDASYLTFIKFTHTPIYCTPGLGDCASVNSSKWSTLWGIPIAVFGLLFYLLVLFLIVFGHKIKFIEPVLNYVLFGICFFGFLFSMYLTYLELFVLHAVCQWCMVSATCATVLFILMILWQKEFKLQANYQED